MKHMRVCFNTPQEVLDFVNRVTKYSCDMDMKRGHVLIDAKSIMGVIGFMGKEVELLVYDENCGKLEQEISQYLVA